MHVPWFTFRFRSGGWFSGGTADGPRQPPSGGYGCLLMEYKLPFAGMQGIHAAAQDRDEVLLIVPARGSFVDQDARVLCWGESSPVRELHLGPASILTNLFAHGSDCSLSRYHPGLLEHEQRVGSQRVVIDLWVIGPQRSFKCKGLPRPGTTLESHGIECQD
jgi:hypothetical protein